jgi:peptidoglycan/xylan/chitin deacetylase (PgdA/CDA1 family)
VRDRAAVTHGDYLGGRFVWMGFSVGSCHETPVQRDAFFSLVRNSMLWAGHQVQAFKPVWQDEKSCVVSITQNIYGPEDVDVRLMALLRKYRVPVTSFVVPEVMRQHPKEMALLAELGEVGVLGDPALDYRGLSMKEQREMLHKASATIKKITGYEPRGFRPDEGKGFSDHTLDALVREGYEYISTAQYDRLVPKAVRSHRSIAVVTAPNILWQMPEMGYIRERPGHKGGNTL